MCLRERVYTSTQKDRKRTTNPEVNITFNIHVCVHRPQRLNCSLVKSKGLRFHVRKCSNIWSCLVKHFTKRNLIQASTPPCTNTCTCADSIKRASSKWSSHKKTHTCLNRLPFHTNNKPSQTLVSYVWLTKTPSLLPLKPPLPTHNKHHTHSLKKHLTAPMADETKRPNMMLIKRTTITCVLETQFNGITETTELTETK